MWLQTDRGEGDRTEAERFDDALLLATRQGDHEPRGAENKALETEKGKEAIFSWSLQPSEAQFGLLASRTRRE